MSHSASGGLQEGNSAQAHAMSTGLGLDWRVCFRILSEPHASLGLQDGDGVRATGRSFWMICLDWHVGIRTLNDPHTTGRPQEGDSAHAHAIAANLGLDRKLCSSTLTLCRASGGLQEGDSAQAHAIAAGLGLRQGSVAAVDTGPLLIQSLHQSAGEGSLHQIADN